MSDEHDWPRIMEIVGKWIGEKRDWTAALIAADDAVAARDREIASLRAENTKLRDAVYLALSVLDFDHHASTISAIEAMLGKEAPDVAAPA